MSLICTQEDTLIISLQSFVSHPTLLPVEIIDAVSKILLIFVKLIQNPKQHSAPELQTPITYFSSSIGLQTLDLAIQKATVPAHLWSLVPCIAQLASMKSCLTSLLVVLYQYHFIQQSQLSPHPLLILLLQTTPPFDPPVAEEAEEATAVDLRIPVKGICLFKSATKNCACTLEHLTNKEFPEVLRYNVCEACNSHYWLPASQQHCRITTCTRRSAAVGLNAHNHVVVLDIEHNSTRHPVVSIQSNPSALPVSFNSNTPVYSPYTPAPSTTPVNNNIINTALAPYQPSPPSYTPAVFTFQPKKVSTSQAANITQALISISSQISSVPLNPVHSTLIVPKVLNDVPPSYSAAAAAVDSRIQVYRAASSNFNEPQDRKRKQREDDDVEHSQHNQKQQHHRESDRCRAEGREGVCLHMMMKHGCAAGDDCELKHLRPDQYRQLEMQHRFCTFVNHAYWSRGSPLCSKANCANKSAAVSVDSATGEDVRVQEVDHSLYCSSTFSSSPKKQESPVRPRHIVKFRHTPSSLSLPHAVNAKHGLCLYYVRDSKCQMHNCTMKHLLAEELQPEQLKEVRECCPHYNRLCFMPKFKPCLKAEHCPNRHCVVALCKSDSNQLQIIHSERTSWSQQ